MAKNDIAPAFTLFIIVVTMSLPFSTMKIHQSTASMKRSTEPTLDWGFWASKTQDFTENAGQILLPTQDPIGISDTDTLRNFSLRLTKGTDNFTDELHDFLLSHRDVTNVWDVYLLRNLLDLYAGIFSFKYSRMTELRKDIAREVEQFRGSSREVHKYFFLERGYWSHLKKFEARTKKFLIKMLTASPTNLALPCTYQVGIYLRLDQLMGNLGVPDPAMKINSTEYFYIRSATSNTTCISLQETFQRTHSKVSSPQRSPYNFSHEQISSQRHTTRGEIFYRFFRQDRDLQDRGTAIPLALSDSCLSFRFVSASEENRAPYIVQALVEGVPHALHFSSAPYGSVVLLPLQQDENKSATLGGADAHLSPTLLLPIRLADLDEVLLVHRLQTRDRQFLAMEQVADSVAVPWPLGDISLQDSAPEDETKTASSKSLRNVDGDGGFYEAYDDAAKGSGNLHPRRNKRRHASDGVLFDSNVRRQEEELHSNALNERIEMVRNEVGARYSLNWQNKIDLESYTRLGSTRTLVYKNDYLGEGAHWLLEEVV